MFYLNKEELIKADNNIAKGTTAISLDFPFTVAMYTDANSSFSTASKLMPVTRYTPNMTTEGSLGTMCFDDDNLYVKTHLGWKKVALSDL